jgi:hypothetical protein
MGFNIGGYTFSAEMARNQNQNSIINKNLLFHVDAGNTNSYSGTGTTWYDLSGRDNHGTLENSPTYSSSDGGGSFNFNGSNQSMVANINSTELDGDPNFTIEMFVKRTAELTGTTAGYWGIGGAGQGYSVEGWTPTTNRIHMDLYDSTRIDSGQDYPLNTWVHVVWSKTGTAIGTDTVKVYVNGVNYSVSLGREQTSAPRYNTSTSGKGIALGRLNQDAASYYGACKIGVARIYNRGLSQGEVLQNYNAQKVRFGL